MIVAKNIVNVIERDIFFLVAKIYIKINPFGVHVSPKIQVAVNNKAEGC